MILDSIAFHYQVKFNWIWLDILLWLEEKSLPLTVFKMSRLGWVGWMSLCFSVMHWNHCLVFFKLAALGELFKI